MKVRVQKKNLNAHYAEGEQKGIANIIDLGINFYLLILRIFILPNPTDPKPVKFRCDGGNGRALGEFTAIENVTRYG